MKIETLPNITPQDIFAGVHKFTFSLYTHKRESDRANKHLEWSAQKHIVLTTLAILTDVGFNSTVAMLAFSGNFLGAALIKSSHYVIAETVPKAVTDLRKKIINRS